MYIYVRFDDENSCKIVFIVLILLNLIKRVIIIFSFIGMKIFVEYVLWNVFVMVLYKYCV